VLRLAQKKEKGRSGHTWWVLVAGEGRRRCSPSRRRQEWNQSNEKERGERNSEAVRGVPSPPDRTGILGSDAVDRSFPPNQSCGSQQKAAIPAASARKDGPLSPVALSPRPNNRSVQGH
jgi:hypothetical protein